MHRLKQSAHNEVYGHLTPTSTGGAGSSSGSGGGIGSVGALPAGSSARNNSPRPAAAIVAAGTGIARPIVGRHLSSAISARSGSPAVAAAAATDAKKAKKATDGDTTKAKRPSGDQDHLSEKQDTDHVVAQPIPRLVFASGDGQEIELENRHVSGEERPSSQSARPGHADADDHEAAPDRHRQRSIALPPDILQFRGTRTQRLFVILRKILFFSWINVLLVMVPVAIAVHFTVRNAVAAFVTATLAIIPLAALLGFATEELAKRFGPATGALLNVTFGNATELIVFILGIVEGEIDVVQAAIIGSVLSNLLLVLGMSFFIGGIRYKEQYYNSTVTQTTGCCLLLAIISLSMPTAFHASFANTAQADRQVLKLSYATSIVLLITYGVYLWFQLRTHTYLYKMAPVAESADHDGTSTSRRSTTLELGETETVTSRRTSMASHVEPAVEIPEIPIVASVLLLLVSTALVAVCAEFMVSSINELVTTTAISAQFVGLILIPIVGNAAEHITAVTVAYKDKMDLALGITLGSSLQIVLLVAPISVLLAWAIGEELTLFFSLFETLAVFATVCIVTYLVIDGRSNYLEGALLMAAYVIIAIASLLYPSGSEESSGL